MLFLLFKKKDQKEHLLFFFPHLRIKMKRTLIKINLKIIKNFKNIKNNHDEKKFKKNFNKKIK